MGPVLCGGQTPIPQEEKGQLTRQKESHDPWLYKHFHKLRHWILQLKRQRLLVPLVASLMFLSPQSSHEDLSVTRRGVLQYFLPGCHPNTPVCFEPGISHIMVPCVGLGQGKKCELSQL